jgi:hypothetical protein
MDQLQICPFSGHPETEEEEVRYKQKVEVLHEITANIKGNEPYLNFSRPKMIVQLTDQSGRSHQFYEGLSGFFADLKRGDIASVRLCKVTRVPMTWYERLWSWARRKK